MRSGVREVGVNTVEFHAIDGDAHEGTLKVTTSRPAHRARAGAADMRYLRGRPDARDRGDRPHMGQGHRDYRAHRDEKRAVRTYTCTKCGATKTETVAALGTSTEQKSKRRQTARMASNAKPVPRTASCPRRVTTSSLPRNARSILGAHLGRRLHGAHARPQSNFSRANRHHGGRKRDKRWLTDPAKEAGGTVGGDRYRGGGRHLLRRRPSISLGAGVQDLRRSLVVNAEGLDTRKGTKITIHATGKDSSGNSVDSVFHAGSDFSDIALRPEITALTIEASPMAADGTIYDTKGASTKVSIDKDGKVNVKKEITIKPVPAEEVTDARSMRHIRQQRTAA